MLLKVAVYVSALVWYPRCEGLGRSAFLEVFPKRGCIEERMISALGGNFGFRRYCARWRAA